MKIWLQKRMPQHLLSRWVGRLANTQCGWLKNLFIRWFIRRYCVDLSEAVEENYRAYPSFNAFFTRALKPGVRSIPSTEQGVLSPADGFVSEWGGIQQQQLMQAKGHYYRLADLLADEVLAQTFHDGDFLTVYLSPKDYHRVHMPIAGTLKQMIYVPGSLFSVNPYTVSHVPGLFARNERVIARFETEQGAMAVIMVGAIIVASIATVWHGLVAPSPTQNVQCWDYSSATVRLAQGDEMGHFQLGSTVILVFEKGRVKWADALQQGQLIRMGEVVAQLSA